MARARKHGGGRGRTSGPTRRADLKWVLRFHDGGKRRRVILDASVSEEDARRIYREKLGSAERAGSGVLVHLTVGELVGKWVKAKETAFAPAWLRNLKSLLANHLLTEPRRDAEGETILDGNGEPVLDVVLRDRVIDRLTPADLDAYVSKRRAQAAAPSSVNREIGALQAALNWGVRRARIIRANPLAGFEKLPENRRTAYFTAEEWTAFSAAFEDKAKWVEHRTATRKLGPVLVNPSRGTERRYGGGRKPDGKASRAYRERLRRSMDVFRACLLTGSRVGEIETLTWDAVDFPAGRVTIVQHKTKRHTEGSDKVIPLSTELRALLKAQGRGAGKALVFQRPGGGQWERAKLERAFTLAKKLSGVRPELTIHSLRHTAASWLTIAGEPERFVRELLGHRDARSTARYAHLAPEHLADAAARLGRMAGRR